MNAEAMSDQIASQEEIAKAQQREKEKQELLNQLRDLIKRAPEYGYVSEELQAQLWNGVNQLFKY
jgi:hypothetical protein